MQKECDTYTLVKATHGAQPATQRSPITHLLPQDAAEDGAHGGNFCRGRGAHRGGSGVGTLSAQKVRTKAVLLQRAHQEGRELGGIFGQGPPPELVLEERNDYICDWGVLIFPSVTAAVGKK